MTPEQWQVMQRLLSGGGIDQNPTFKSGQNYIQNLLSGSPESFEAFERPYKSQFEQEIVPGLAERFSGLGAQKSSGFQQALGAAGANLSERLASLRGQMQLGALGQGLQYAQQPYSNLQNLLGLSGMGYAKKDMPFWQQLLLGFANQGSNAVSQLAPIAGQMAMGGF
jgi:hypothetical protein